MGGLEDYGDARSEVKWGATRIAVSGKCLRSLFLCLWDAYPEYSGANHVGVVPKVVPTQPALVSSSQRRIVGMSAHQR